MALLDLPKSEKELVRALEAELGPAESEANVHKVTWKIIDAYLKGYRSFKVTNWEAGNLEIAFENFDGGLEMRYEKVLKSYLTEAGRYMKANISPVGSKKGESLDSLRKGAMAHATLGSVTQPIDLQELKRMIVVSWLKYGTVGLHHWETGPEGHVRDCIEVVHPRELRGIPAWVDGLGNLQGIARKRWVPWDWLRRRIKDRYGRKPQFDTADLESIDLQWGASLPDREDFDFHGSSGAGSGSAEMDARDAIGVDIGRKRKRPQRAQTGDKGASRPFVPLEEIYSYTDDQAFVSRYIIKVGKRILADEDFEAQNKRVVCPLNAARHTDIGRFFARGFVGPMLALNDQVERMLASLFKNVHEIDLFGTLLIPGGMGLDTDLWKAGPRPRVQRYEPDLAAPQHKPDAIQPVTSGTLPAKVAEIGSNLLDEASGQGPMFGGQSSGRVDSASAYGFLFDTSNIALGLPSHGLADALAKTYASLLQRAKARLKPGETIKLAVIDDAIAGVVINEDGTLGLDSNPIPDPWDVHIDIKDRVPRDPDARKQELMGLYQAELVTSARFWLTAFEEHLDFPGADKALWEAYRKAIWQIVVLFRDGKTPGQIDVGEHSTNPEVQLMAVQQFMNKIEFSLASQEIRAAFEKWKQTLEAYTGVYPEGMPPPEVLAQEQQASLGQMGGGPPGMPPMV